MANFQHPLLGKNVIIRTHTMVYTGYLDAATEDDFVLLKAAWIPETARYAEFVSSGAVNECEPYPDDLPVYVTRAAKLDMHELRADLPRKQK